jgi:hypothetical protein
MDVLVDEGNETGIAAIAEHQIASQGAIRPLVLPEDIRASGVTA